MPEEVRHRHAQATTHVTTAHRTLAHRQGRAARPIQVPADAPTLTTNQGLAVNNDQDSLKAGDRGPSLLEDFHLREKITHFDHEGIPERVVHARGSGAHGVFATYDSLADLTKASFLGEAGRQTPVFVRFSTVAGSRGSIDLARDVPGFAVKSYIHEGNLDRVGNNMPVFFIRDAIARPRQPQHRRAQAPITVRPHRPTGCRASAWSPSSTGLRRSAAVWNSIRLRGRCPDGDAA